jgi:hypothetical protein
VIRTWPPRSTGRPAAAAASSAVAGAPASPDSAPSPAPPGRPARRDATRPSASRTLNADAPAACAIACRAWPAAPGSVTRATTSAVSLDGRLGPFRSGISPATPPGKGLVPPPDSDRIHPERRRDRGLSGRPQPH